MSKWRVSFKVPNTVTPAIAGQLVAGRIIQADEVKIEAGAGALVFFNELGEILEAFSHDTWRTVVAVGDTEGDAEHKGKPPDENTR